MNNEPLRPVFEKYVDYVQRFQRDFDAQIGPHVAAEYRAKLLSFEEFSQVWDRWGETEGLQELWAERLEEGYDCFAARLTGRLRAALTNAEEPTASEAA